jgi:hypothetical protein
MFDPTTLSEASQIELQALVYAFPQMLDEAVTRWAKFKVGYDGGLFTPDQVSEIIGYYQNFPKIWNLIRPSFDPTQTPVMRLTAEDSAVFQKADNFIKKLDGELSVVNGLGLAPIIIAGIAIAASATLALVIWTISQAKKQSNISKMIDGVVDGKIPPSVLNEAIKEEHSSLFGSFFSSLKWILIGGVLIYLWPIVGPQLRKVLGSENA